METIDQEIEREYKESVQLRILKRRIIAMEKMIEDRDTQIKKLGMSSKDKYVEVQRLRAENERLRECGIKMEDSKEKFDNHLCRALGPNKKGGDKVSYGTGCSQRVENIIKDIDSHMKEAVKTKKRRPSKKDCDMTEKQVRHYLSERIWKHFCKWITGQTVPELPNGDIGYYRHDVERFADWCILKEPTYFD